MKSNKEFLKENIEDIIKLRNSGMYLDDIGNKYGVSGTTIGRILKEVGIVTRKELTEDDIQEIIKLYREGMIIADIGKKFHKTGSVISEIIKNNNVERIIKKERKTVEKVITKEMQLYIDEFNDGLIISEIAKKYNKTYSYIHNKIKGYVKLRERKEITYEDELNIVKLYKSDKSSVEIGDMYDVHYTRITKILEKHGVNRNYASNRKYELNETYFDDIDTPNKAYILGFLYADGCNYKPKQTISISLQEEDKYILERMRLEIKSEKPLEFLDYSNKHDFGYTYKNQYRLLMFSSYMCNSLEKIGMTPNKSLTLEFPNIDESLYSHFIRGYMDGDGCIYDGHLSFTSTNNFCLSLQNIFIKLFNIKGKISDASCHNGVTATYNISKKSESKIILDWLYKNADMYLERKYSRYLNAFYKTSIA